jgi:hypothetical protein
MLFTKENIEALPHGKVEECKVQITGYVNDINNPNKYESWIDKYANFYVSMVRLGISKDIKDIPPRIYFNITIDENRQILARVMSIGEEEGNIIVKSYHTTWFLRRI